MVCLDSVCFRHSTNDPSAWKKSVFTNRKCDNFQLWIHGRQVGFAAEKRQKKRLVFLKYSTFTLVILAALDKDLILQTKVFTILRLALLYFKLSYVTLKCTCHVVLCCVVKWQVVAAICSIHARTCLEQVRRHIRSRMLDSCM